MKFSLSVNALLIFLFMTSGVSNAFVTGGVVTYPEPYTGTYIDIEDTPIIVNNTTELDTLMQSLQFVKGSNGRAFIELIREFLKSETNVSSYTFVFNKTTSISPHGVSRMELPLFKVIENGPECKTELDYETILAAKEANAIPSNNYKNTTSQVGGACGLMAIYRSMFRVLKLQPPAGMPIEITAIVKKENMQVMNPNLTEHILKPAAPYIYKGMLPEQIFKTYESYNDDPNNKVSCDTMPVVNRISGVNSYEILKAECDGLASKLKSGHDCSSRYYWGPNRAHAELTTKATWDEKSLCCIVESEDGVNQGTGMNFPISSLVKNITKSCVALGLSTSSIDRKQELKEFKVSCCHKEPRQAGADSREIK